MLLFFFFFQAEDGIRDTSVTGVQTCALPILENYKLDLNASETRWQNRTPSIKYVNRWHTEHIYVDRNTTQEVGCEDVLDAIRTSGF